MKFTDDLKFDTIVAESRREITLRADIFCKQTHIFNDIVHKIIFRFD